MENKYIGERILANMMGLYGLAEIPGNESNAELLDIIKSVIPWANDDSTISWCGIVMTYVFQKEGLGHLVPSKPAGARSWLNIEGTIVWQIGDDINLISKLAKPGDIVVFWRNSIDDWRGHVAQYLNEYDYDKSKIRVIGGNQDNAVVVRPYSKDRVLKIIRP